MLKRSIASHVLEALKDTPVILINGPRQAGKSTLVKQLAGNTHGERRYITFDNADTLASAKADPQAFITELAGPVVLDEVQRAPEIFLPIKMAVDNDRVPGRFLLTGSANVFTLPRMADSLAGRMEVIPLWPFSQGELLSVKERFLDSIFSEKLPRFNAEGVTREDMAELLLRGGYPEAVARTGHRREAFFNSYVTALLNRDVRDITGISDVTQLTRLITAVASRVGSLLNVADLSRTLDAPATTIRRYIHLLEAIFLTQSLPAWSINTDTRVIKSPRLFFTDTGLLAHQIQVSGQSVLDNSFQFGRLLENFVITELRKQMGWSRAARSMSYYRTQEGTEVDIVLEGAGGKVVGIEIKAASTLNKKDFKGLQHLSDKLGSRFLRGIVLYTGEEQLPFGPKMYCMPVSALWAG